VITYDELICKYEDEVDVYEHPLRENPLVRKRKGKGFYYHDGKTKKGTALIEQSLTQIDKKCTLAEELGHHHTSSGNILNLKFPNSTKQERLAREWGAKQLIDHDDFITALNTYDNIYQIAKELDVTYDILIIYIDFVLRKSNL
jgi:Zn-dependent peptidase ImmA (M78 family)